MDIKSPFFTGQLVQDICVICAPGIGLEGKTLELNNELYGLKQAPLPWFQMLLQGLAETGFIARPFHLCVLISVGNKRMVVVYVDHITPAGSHSNINRYVDHLVSRF